MSECIECRSLNTNLFRGDDGHFRKECEDCGHVGGPYISADTMAEESDEADESAESVEQQTLDSFT